MRRVIPARVDARTTAIRDAALRVFVRKGVESATMQDIAAEAGLTAAAIYRYYPSKEHLLRAVLALGVAQRRAGFADLLAPAASPLARLTAHVPHLARMLQAPETRAQTVMALETILAATRDLPELAAERGRMWQAEHALVADLLRQARAAGELDAVVDADALAVVLQAGVWGLTLMNLELGQDAGDGALRAGLDAAPTLLVDMVQRMAPAGPPHS